MPTVKITPPRAASGSKSRGSCCNKPRTKPFKLNKPIYSKTPGISQPKLEFSKIATPCSEACTRKPESREPVSRPTSKIPTDMAKVKKIPSPVSYLWGVEIRILRLAVSKTTLFWKCRIDSECDYKRLRGGLQQDWLDCHTRWDKRPTASPLQASQQSTTQRCVHVCHA